MMAMTTHTKWEH